MHKQETKKKMVGKGVRIGGQPTLESIYCGLFPESVAAGCSTFRLTEIVMGIIYVLRISSH